MKSRTNKEWELKHDVPEPVLTALGDLAVSFSLLEEMLQHLCDGFIDGPQRTTEIAFSLLPFKNLRNLAGALYREVYEEDADYKRLKSLLVKSSQLEDFRNKAMHSSWLQVHGSNESVVRVKRVCRERRGYGYDKEMLTAGDLRKGAREMRLLSGAILNFHTELLDRRTLERFKTPQNMRTFVRTVEQEAEKSKARGARERKWREKPLQTE